MGLGTFRLTWLEKLGRIVDAVVNAILDIRETVGRRFGSSKPDSASQAGSDSSEKPAESRGSEPPH